MPKSVLDVGNCSPDHYSISRLLSTHFDVDIVQTHGEVDTLDQLKARPFDLVLVNRIMDRGGENGLEIIERIKGDESLKQVPVMMITNFPDHQDLAVAAGAEPGFGKRSLQDAETLQRLSTWLGE